MRAHLGRVYRSVGAETRLGPWETAARKVWGSPAPVRVEVEQVAQGVPLGNLRSRALASYEATRADVRGIVREVQGKYAQVAAQPEGPASFRGMSVGAMRLIERSMQEDVRWEVDAVPK